MTSFISRQILTSQTTGERLAKVRSGAGLALTVVARRIGISERYLEAIEGGQYNELPGDIYTLEFIKKYAAFLRLDPQEVTRDYVVERERYTPPRPAPPRPPLWPRLAPLLRLSAVAAGVVLGGYGLTFTRVWFAPPRLEVFSPALYYEATDSLVVLSGRAEPESKLFVNNEEIALDAGGAFSQAFNLTPGYTLLKITTQDKRGRATTDYRLVRAGGGQARPPTPGTGGQVAGASTTKEKF